MVKVSGKAIDQNTRDWTKLVEIELRTRMEAINWISFNRDWMKDFQIDGVPYGSFVGG